MKTRFILALLLAAGVCARAATTVSFFVINSGTTNIAHFGVNAGVGLGMTYVCGASGSVAWTLGDVPAGSAILFPMTANWGYPLTWGFGPSGGTVGQWPVGVTNLGTCVGTISSAGAVVTLHLQAGNPATNCVFPINIQNTDVFPKVYALFKNDVLTGTYWSVPGLSSVQDTYIVPDCDSSGYTLRVVYNGTINGPLVDLGNGAGRINGGPTSGILTLGGDNELLGLTNTFGPIQLPPGAAGPGQNTNGPISYGPNSNPTNAANNGTIETGDNALYTATVNGDDSLLQAVNQVDSDLRANTASTSNMLGQVTNALAHLTNGGSGSNADYSGVLNEIASNTLGTENNTAFLTNFGQISNQLSASFVLQLSNMQSAGIAAGASISNAFGAALTGFPTAPSVGAGADGVHIATAGGAPDVVLSVAALPQSFDLARTVISWVIWLMTYVAMIQFAQEKVLRILNQRQAQGTEQEILGVNLSIPTAFAYAAVIAATVAAFPIAIASYLHSASSSVGSFGGLSSLSSGPLWNLMTQLVPVSVIITAFFSYLTFRYLLAFPLIIISVTIIMFMLV